MERIKVILYDLYHANIDPETDDVAKNNIENASEEITTYLIGELTKKSFPILVNKIDDTRTDVVALDEVEKMLKGEK